MKHFFGRIACLLGFHDDRIYSVTLNHGHVWQVLICRRCESHTEPEQVA